MFKLTVIASKLREEMAYYLGQVKGSDVIQILHRGDSVKVMMTQQHYLEILSRLAVYERESGTEVAHPSKEKLKKKLESRLKKVKNEKEGVDGSIGLGRARPRSA